MIYKKLVGGYTNHVVSGQHRWLGSCRMGREWGAMSKSQDRDAQVTPAGKPALPSVEWPQRWKMRPMLQIAPEAPGRARIYAYRFDDQDPHQTFFFVFVFLVPFAVGEPCRLQHPFSS